ncbi:hypothetical protein HDU99_005907 [Rhizoclosmatium hyalinum]|nr:hypothetical protein HDU99_005907 [Rhizoclosmatium hyalinum]
MKYDAHKGEASRRWAAKQRKAGNAVPVSHRRQRAEAATATATSIDTDSDADADADANTHHDKRNNKRNESESESESDIAGVDAQTAALRKLIADAENQSTTGFGAFDLLLDSDASAEDAFDAPDHALLLHLDVKALNARLATLPLHSRLNIDEDALKLDLELLEEVQQRKLEQEQSKPIYDYTASNDTSEYAKRIKEKSATTQAVNLLDQITSSPSVPSPATRSAKQEQLSSTQKSDQSQKNTNRQQQPAVVASLSKPTSSNKKPVSPSHPYPKVTDDDDELDALLSGSSTTASNTTTTVKAGNSVKPTTSRMIPSKPSTAQLMSVTSSKKTTALKSSTTTTNEADDLAFLDDLLE